ncbi:MAG: hypothetical protein LBN07_03535 [Christensenellaceae bacterium]|nr:hypothetical protein [Christensenellaceae bacterium]
MVKHLASFNLIKKEIFFEDRKRSFHAAIRTLVSGRFMEYIQIADGKES